MLQKAEDERLAKQKKEQDAEAERLRFKEVALKAQEKAVQMEKDRIAKVDADLKAAKEAKIQAAKDAEYLAKHQAKEAAEAEERARAEAARQEALLPDKEKLLLYADKIRELTAANLDVKSEDARGLFHITLNKIMAVENNFRAAIEVL